MRAKEGRPGYGIMLQVSELQQGITRLLRSSTYNQYDDLSGLEINYEDSEELFRLDELRGIMEKLADVEDAIRYMGQPVREVGRLWKNAAGRYETESGHYFCCGSPIEALVSDSRYDVPYWVRTSIEHDGHDYFLVGHRHVSLDGLTVRIRKTL